MLHLSSFFALAMAVGIGFADPKSIRIPLVTDARGEAPTTWKYTTVDPGANWADTGFIDLAWQSGTGGFGTGTPENSHIKTAWSTGRIWLRTAFTLPDVSINAAVLSLYHDEDVEIFLNGKPVFQEASFVINYAEPALSEEFKAALKPGRNVLAITCANLDGPGYIDAGLAVVADFEAATLVGDARAAAPADWSYTTLNPGADWAAPGFDASAWSTGKGRFGTTPDYPIATAWAGPDIWLRTTFQVAAKSSHYALSYMHDDGMEAYVNGVAVLLAPGWNAGHAEAVSAAVAAAVVVGTNTLAVHCHNDQGDSGLQFVDAGLFALEKPVATRLADPSGKLPASGRGPTLWLGTGPALDLSSLAALGPGRVTVFGTDGRKKTEFRTGGAARVLALPVPLAGGVFRYRWEAAPGQPNRARAGSLGSLQGTLLKLP